METLFISQLIVDGRFSLNLKFDKGVNFIVGRNGTGKTTLINIIKWILSNKAGDIWNIQSINYAELIFNDGKYKIKKIRKDRNFQTSILKNNEIIISLAEFRAIFLDNLHEEIKYEDLIDFSFLSGNFTIEKIKYNNVYKYFFLKQDRGNLFIQRKRDFEKKKKEIIENLTQHCKSQIRNGNIDGVLIPLLKKSLNDKSIDFLNLYNRNEKNLINEYFDEIRKTNKILKEKWYNSPYLNIDFEEILRNKDFLFKNEYIHENLKKKSYFSIYRKFSHREAALFNFIIFNYVYSKSGLNHPIFIDELFNILDLNLIIKKTTLLENKSQIFITSQTINERFFDDNMISLEFNTIVPENVFTSAYLQIEPIIKFLCDKNDWVLSKEINENVGSYEIFFDYTIQIGKKIIGIELKSRNLIESIPKLQFFLNYTNKIDGILAIDENQIILIQKNSKKLSKTIYKNNEQFIKIFEVEVERVIKDE